MDGVEALAPLSEVVEALEVLALLLSLCREEQALVSDLSSF